jgi:two-component system cell cycle sensor histidine kinase/response regulator CckA
MNSRPQLIPENVLRLCSVLVLTLSGAALVGWFTGSDTLRAIRAGYIPMAPNTALVFVLLGAVIALHSFTPTRFRWAVRAAAIITIAIVATRLGEYFTGAELQVDHWFFSFPAEQMGLAPVGKMAFFTAVSFSCLAFSLLFMTSNRRWANDFSKALSIVVAASGLTFSLGYFYGVPLLYGGKSVPMAFNTAVCFLIFGTGLLIRGLHRDASERRLATEALQEAHDQLEQHVAERTTALLAKEEFLRAVVETSPNAIFVKDSNGRFTFVNKAVESAYGLPAEEIIGKTEHEINGNPIEVQSFINGDAEVIQTLTTKFIAEEQLTNQSTGKTCFYQTIKVPLKLAGAETIQVLGVATEITDLKEADQALRDSEQRYRLLFESNPQPMWVYDLKTLAFLAVNEAAVFHYGYSREEFLSMTIKDIRPSEDIPALLDNISTTVWGINQSGGWKHAKKNGTIMDVEIISHHLIFDGKQAELVLIKDITERTRAEKALHEAEEQLRQSQKLEGVGQLAGGIAHDFNNLLTVIGGYTDLVLNEAKLDDPTREKIDEVRKAAERASSLTRQLLAFSRKQVLKPQVLEPNTLLERVGKMLRRLIGEDIELVTFLGTDVGRINADPSQIEQVVINLVVNARDAMPDGGKITVKTANVELDDAYSDMHIAVTPGPYVMIAITDTGCGMDPETRKHIFEPFFTTKEVGRGTGLGLSTIYGIVKQSGGNIWVYSELGKGTTFKIYLPRVMTERTNETFKEKPEATFDQSNETILLVEDEEMVRKLAHDILQTGGFRVLVANGGEEALEACKTHKGVINLMLTDVVMPGMNGTKVAQSARSYRPDMQVLFMSGYTDDAIIHHGVLDPRSDFIEKPFTAHALISKVRETLNKKEMY